MTRIVPRFLTIITATTANHTQRLTVGSKVEYDDTRDKSLSEDSER